MKIITNCDQFLFKKLWFLCEKGDFDTKKCDRSEKRDFEEKWFGETIMILR